jgi:predicted nuclease of predicted toxin-antitoxin system
VKIDECLPREIADIVAGLGCEVETVISEGLAGSPDDLVWSAAQAEGRFLITTDLDFSDIRRYAPGTHAGFLLLRLRKEGKQRILAYVRWLFAQHNLADWQGCAVIATQHKVRIRRPDPPTEHPVVDNS